MTRACPCGGECKGQVGHFYVSVKRDHKAGAQYVLALGPFETHEEALSWIASVRHHVEEKDPRGAWYAYGTARSVDAGPGKLNADLAAV